MGLIKRIAIIGGGPAGLLAAEDLYRQKEDQKWEIIGFEAKHKLGGVWSDVPGSELNSPEVFEQLKKLPLKKGECPTPEEIFQYGSPLVANGRIANLKSLIGTSAQKPLKLARQSLVRDGLILSAKTGVYDDLITNVPRELMAFDADNHSSSKPVNSDLDPLMSLDEVQENSSSFIESSKSSRVFRTDTCVEYLEKLSPEKWLVVAKRSAPDSTEDEWYMETFDAVIIANGHFSCPYVPFYMSNLHNSDANIHQFNLSYPGALIHVRDLDLWYHNAFQDLKQKLKSTKLQVVIVGKSFSAMDVLRRLVPLQNESGGNLEIILSTITPPKPDNTANPFCWFDEWLSLTDKVTVKGPISKFVTDRPEPAVQFEDGFVAEKVSTVIFATGYLYTFPFISSNLLQNYRVLITPDTRNTDSSPSNISRVTGLYLHTFSIADPTMGFVGISSNANFKSFTISSHAITGAWSKVNKLFDQLQPSDGPIYDSIWSKVLPSVQDQLEWSKERILKTGNNGAYHFYYPLSALQEEWLRYCEPLFKENDQHTPLFSSEAPFLSQQGLLKLKNRFLATMGPENV